ncbi:MAG: DUF1858 domain-containing protein [Clostridiales bacterium]|jgi:hybrid cluster-associated redox disulfide protein|nr:DUF1858 domain-containing protein [Clostridiales bacterium]
MRVTKEMTIANILNMDEGIADILMSAGMHCLGCAMAHGEDLGQACAVHGIDANEMVANINMYLEDQENRAKV